MSPSRPPRPDILFIVSDDQGAGDLSCAGAADLATPALDALARQGCRFDSFYANAPVCSPSRAAILTGRHPARAGVRSILAGHRQASGLSPSIPTAPALLQAAGYHTFLSGKWHLGTRAEARPSAHGFDDWFGFLAGCVDYYSHIFYWGSPEAAGGAGPVHDLWEDNTEVWRNGEYLTDLITDHAVSALRRAHATDRPFFGLVSYNAPHYPMHAPPALLDRFPDLPPARRIYAAMLAAMDDGIGRIVDELHALGRFENTLIVFMSDNGPSREVRNWLDGSTSPYPGGSTGGLKGHKFSLFEGGLRVPGILCWPAGIPGGRVLPEPVAGFDLLPTVLAATGVASPEGLDGTNLLPWLAGEAPAPTRTLFWEMDAQTALRDGPWKLVLEGRLVEAESPPCPIHLSRLDLDPGETRNLADDEPELTRQLQQRALTWRAGLEEEWSRCWSHLPVGLTGASSTPPGS